MEGEKRCIDCARFVQHYVKSGDRFVKAYCGHCTQPTLKYIPPDMEGCVHFVSKSFTSLRS